MKKGGREKGAGGREKGAGGRERSSDFLLHFFA